MLLDFISQVAELKAVMTYPPAFRLMLSFAAPFLSVVRLYIMPRRLKETLILGRGVPFASVKMALYCVPFLNILTISDESNS